MTSMRRIPKPERTECVQYVREQYVDLVPDDGLVLEHLRTNLDANSAFLRSLPTGLLAYRYATGKWTIKQIVQHLSDDERIYAYRALRFARGDSTELPGFDQDAFAAEARSSERSLDDLLSELATVRSATLSLYDGFDDEELLRSGVASGNMMSVRAIAYHLAGHEQRHINVIRERYVPAR